MDIDNDRGYKRSCKSYIVLAGVLDALRTKQNLVVEERECDGDGDEESSEEGRQEGCKKESKEGAEENPRWRNFWNWSTWYFGNRAEALMILGDAKKAYEDLSAKASDIIRQLSLAGIGLIWVFKVSAGSSFVLEPKLLRGLAFIFLALFFDLLQYLVGTVTWYLYFRKKEKENVASDAEFTAPDYINLPTWILFGLKAAAMFVAYSCFILPFLVKKFIG